LNALANSLQRVQLARLTAVRRIGWR